ncbi:OmpA family protein [Olleya namhaensis]|uniref:OmpA family protein n=1 Tax=Olleya namhaensis TaxID=1144750 RepID=A0A1I3KTJ1_9FLAO|nr:OmpA family protein [Olleya namhaensis]SFI75813.1 OmpA family protein [Olleya namhaensis]
MRKYFILGVSLLSFAVQAQDMPSNPKAGKCYVRCLSEDNKISDWEELNCDLMSFQELKLENIKSGAFSENDKKNIKSVLKLLDRNLNVEIRSHFDSNGTEDYNIEQSKKTAKLLLNYLFSNKETIDSKQIRVLAVGNTMPLQECAETDNCSLVYNKNTRFEFRVINRLPDPKEGFEWFFEEKTKTWVQIEI